MLSGLNEIFFTQISATVKKELHKIYVGPEACVGKRKSKEVIIENLKRKPWFLIYQDRWELLLGQEYSLAR